MMKRIGLAFAVATLGCCVAVAPAQAWSKRAARITAMAWAHVHCGDEVYKCNGGRLTSLKETGINEYHRNQWTFVVEGVETKRPNLPYDPLLPSKQAVKWVGGITPDGKVRNGMKLVDVILFPFRRAETKGYTPISKNKAEGIANALSEKDCVGRFPDLARWRCMLESVQASTCATTHMTSPSVPGWLCPEVYLQKHWLRDQVRACHRAVAISPKGEILRKYMTRVRCQLVIEKPAVLTR
jgi:hypothetical protein